MRPRAPPTSDPPPTSTPFDRSHDGVRTSEESETTENLDTDTLPGCCPPPPPPLVLLAASEPLKERPRGQRRLMKRLIQKCDCVTVISEFTAGEQTSAFPLPHTPNQASRPPSEEQQASPGRKTTDWRRNYSRGNEPCSLLLSLPLSLSLSLTRKGSVASAEE